MATLEKAQESFQQNLVLSAVKKLSKNEARLRAIDYRRGDKDPPDVVLTPFEAAALFKMMAEFVK